MTDTRPFALDTAHIRPETWEDPARGTLHWRSLFDAARTPTDSLVCGVAEMEPGDHFALHRHPQAEVYFGIEGEGEVMIDGRPHRLAPGVALFIPGNAEHGVPQCDRPLRWFYVFAADSFAEISYRFSSPPGA